MSDSKKTSSSKVKKLTVSDKKPSKSVRKSPASSPRTKKSVPAIDGIAGAASLNGGIAEMSTLSTPKGHTRKRSVPSISGLSDTEADATLYEQLDLKITQSKTFQDLWRIARMVSAQTTFSQMCTVLETQSVPFIHATSVRFLIVDESSGQFVHNRKHFSIDEGIAGYVYEQREIVNLENPSDDKRYCQNVDSDPTVGKAGSLMCVPFVADSTPDCQGPKDVIGVIIAVKQKGEKNFNNRDCIAMYRLGEFAGNTLRNARRLDMANAAYAQSKTSERRGRALLDIAKALSSENRLDRLVSLIVSQVPELLDCDRCTLFFVDKESQQLIVTRGASSGRPRSFSSWIFGQSNAPELPFEEGSNEFRFDIKRGIAGHVAITGETINIPDAHKDSRFNPAIDKSTGYLTRSILCMPMKDASGEIVGVVQAINKNPASPAFSSDDETMLATFSAQAAVAVRNSKLWEKTERALKRSDALLDVTNALSKELELTPLLRIIVSKVQHLILSQRCTVFIVDAENQELYTSEDMSFGMGAALPIDHERAEMIRFPMSRGIAGNVATTGNTINIPDAYKDSRFSQTMDKQTGFHTKSILCMPIRNHKGEIIGVAQAINKIYKDPHTGKEKISVFNAEDERMLLAFNAQAAVAIENSRLFTQTESALNHALADQRNLKFLLSVTKNLFSDMHLSSMIEQMTMQVHHLLKADNCALYLIDTDTKEFFLAKDETDPTHKRYPFTVGIVGQVAATGRPIRISKDAFKDPRFHESVDQRKGHVTHSILCCPITAETQNATQVIGVISVRDEKDRGGFEREEENLLKVFCAQAAVAIINSKRFTSMLDSSEFKERDHSAVQYLAQNRGMHLASDNIDDFQYSMDEVRLIQPIGTGSYGEVYKAEVRGKIVAVKKLHVRSLKAEQVDSFCKEASLMCQLDHPNIVMFVGAITEPSNLCIITEFCPRGSLADILLDHSIPMTYGRKLRISQDACRGMVYLHSSNPTILHRDLKSDNLLVGDSWEIKVADFGLTRFLTEKKAMTQVGTPMWMAPEIIMGKKYTEKADIYAFGIILWEILTRLEPYEDKEPMQIVVEVVNEDLRPHIPKEHRNNPLIPVMKDCWAPNPDDRPTFKVLQERLDELVKQYGDDD